MWFSLILLALLTGNDTNAVTSTSIRENDTNSTSIAASDTNSTRIRENAEKANVYASYYISRSTKPAVGTNFYIYRFVYPNPELTPGAVFSWVTSKEVCVPHYTEKVRKVSSKLKRQVFERYNVPQAPGVYEVDHLVSLELGGSNAIENLWPEAYEGTFGARAKDVVENDLHRRVCRGEMKLEEAQHIIKTDWVSWYKKLKGME